MKVAIAGYYGFSNVGDELLLQVVLRGMAERMPKAVPVVLSNDPAATRAQHGVEAVSRWNVRTVWDTIGGSDRLILGGGGVFQDRTSRRSLLYYAGLVALARSLGTPVILCAVGVDPFKSRISRMAVRLALGQGEVEIGVRDSLSASALSDAGLHRGVNLFADLVFSLEPPAVEPQKRAALVVRSSHGRGGELIFFWAAQALGSRGWGVEAMSFQRGVDAETAVAAGGPVAPFVGFSEAPARVAGCGVVVSARFHALVLAAIAGRPFIGIGDEGKSQSLCRQLGMPFLRWSAARLDVEAAVDELLAAGPPDARRVGALRRRANEALDDAFGLL